MIELGAYCTGTITAPRCRAGGPSRQTRSVTRAELMASHHITWGARDSALVVVGDVEPDRVSALAEEAFGGWETERPPRPVEAPWIALDSSEVARALGVESNAPRSLVLIMEQAPPRLSRDYLPFKVLAMVVGGMQSARLSRDLRESVEGGAGIRVVYDARLSGGESRPLRCCRPSREGNLLGDQQGVRGAQPNDRRRADEG